VYRFSTAKTHGLLKNSEPEGAEPHGPGRHASARTATTAVVPVSMAPLLTHAINVTMLKPVYSL